MSLTLVPKFAGLANLRPGDVPVAVDIPMGLLESVDLRPCDRQARELLGERVSTVFAPPSRPLLAAASYADGRALIAEEQATSPGAEGVSAQSFGIAPKMRQADEYVRANPDAQRWLSECHPKLSFSVLTGGKVLVPRKGVSGQTERLRLLCDRFPGVLDALRSLPDSSKKAELADALDALVRLDTALRVCAKDYERLGGETDAEGLVIRMMF